MASGVCCSTQSPGIESEIGSNTMLRESGVFVSPAVDKARKISLKIILQTWVPREIYLLNTRPVPVVNQR